MDMIKLAEDTILVIQQTQGINWPKDHQPLNDYCMCKACCCKNQMCTHTIDEDDE